MHANATIVTIATKATTIDSNKLIRNSSRGNDNQSQASQWPQLKSLTTMAVTAAMIINYFHNIYCCSILLS